MVVSYDGCASSRTEEPHRAAFHTLGQEARFAAPPGEGIGQGRVAITVAAWQGASRDPQGAVRPTYDLSRRKLGRGESTGAASPGEPRPPLPSKGIPRDKRG